MKNKLILINDDDWLGLPKYTIHNNEADMTDYLKSQNLLVVDMDLKNYNDCYVITKNEIGIEFKFSTSWGKEI